MFESYIKPIEGESYDKFQLTCMQNGGNKEFTEYLEHYGKERAII